MRRQYHSDGCGSVNNSPSVQDEWNTNPMWPFQDVDTVGIMPMQPSLPVMTLANQGGGGGMYGFCDAVGADER